jgi:uncharacterized protein YecE (DUF72 family)
MILIGTSGFSFPDWVGPFYPPGTDRGKMLDHYVCHFPAVEVNATYYRIPPPSTLHAMERKTPPGFEFVVKAHHDMTHERSLEADLYRSFARSVEPLQQAGKLSGVLAQFPYAFRRTRENEKFLGELKERLPEAPLFVEFRHNSWVRDDLFPWLEEQGLGYVSVDEPDLPGLVPPIARATGPLGYVRLHGRNKTNWWQPERGERAFPGSGPRPKRERPAGRPRSDADYGPLFSTETAAADTTAAGPTAAGAPAEPRPWDPGDRYDYLYSEAELKEWVDKIRELSTKAKKTFVFFNNCHVGQAATGAKLMRRLLEGEGLL